MICKTKAEELNEIYRVSVGSGFGRTNLIRKLVRDILVKRNSYIEFVHWLKADKPERPPKRTPNRFTLYFLKF